MDITNKEINVPQRQYAFAVKGSEVEELITHNIFTCTALYGFDKEQGLAFLCHFDSPSSVKELPVIISELQQLAKETLNIEYSIQNGSPIAMFGWTNRTRNAIRKIMNSLKIYATEAKLKQSFSRNFIRSRFKVSANTFNATRQDYIFSKNYPKLNNNKKMIKAIGSA